MVLHVRHTDYDDLAAAFDRRYDEDDYSGVVAALDAFVGSSATAVLEVGCGTGHWLRQLAKRGLRLAGLDPSAGMLARAKTQAVDALIVRGTAERLPWLDATFERVFCVNALHHFPDKTGFIAEAARVLQPGGELMTIGLDPHTGIDRWFVYDYFETVLDLDKVRYPATSQLRDWMQAAGFVNCATREVQQWTGAIDGRAAVKHGRLDQTTTSQLRMLTDDEYREGLDRIISAAATAETRGESLLLSVDLRLYATSGSIPNVTGVA
jgi:ubiquinone/menaquinone biosynthesis C-methylase UbiE